MPTPIRSFNRMKITAPCTADWDSMAGNDQVRFCEHCQLDVTNLSSMTRENAMQLVARSQGRLCVRFITTPRGRILTGAMPEKLYRIRRRVSRIAATAFSATISVSTAMAQNPTVSNAKDPQEILLIEPETRAETIVDEFTAGVRGMVKDPDGAAISNATVVLVNQETGEEQTVISSAPGNYAFEFLPQGDYLLWARKPGFRTESEMLTVAANTRIEVDVEMSERARSVGVMGGVGVGILIERAEDPLFKAVSAADVEKVRALAYADTNLNAPNRYNYKSLLTTAVEGGNREIIQTLLALGADANLRDGVGATPLMYLSERTSPEVLRDLLAAGARLNARERNGNNAFMIAASSGSVRVLREMIEAGAQINALSISGENALFAAARSNSPDAIVLLLEAGVDPNATDEDGNTALMAMASYGKFENFRTLIDRGARHDLRNADGETLLMLAVTNEDPRLAKLLVETGADIDATNRYGSTALMSAAESGRLESLLLLASAGVDLDKQDEDGQTALMKAIWSNSSGCIEALLKAGANLKLKNHDGETALSIARDADQAEVVKLLESRGAPD
jgi:ankyrin repeat protein